MQQKKRIPVRIGPQAATLVLDTRALDPADNGDGATGRRPARLCSDPAERPPLPP